MKILFFDTETTGKPTPETMRGEVSENFKEWPRIWQIAWQEFELNSDGSYQLLAESSDHIQCPDGDWVAQEGNPVPINHEQCRIGWPASAVFSSLAEEMHHVDLIVCHNLAFDSRFFESECHRLNDEGWSFRLPPKKSQGKAKICIMTSSSKFCNLPKPDGKKGLKWPSLQELHTILFGEKYENAHDALADVQATSRCFFELVKRGVIQLPTKAIHD